MAGAGLGPVQIGATPACGGRRGACAATVPGVRRDRAGAKGIPEPPRIAYDGRPHRHRPARPGRANRERMTLDDESSKPKSRVSAEKKGIPAPKITRKTAAIGAAVGIGSAAIVAALLYANRNKS